MVVLDTYMLIKYASLSHAFKVVVLSLMIVKTGDVCTPATNTVCSSDLPSSRIEDSKLKHLDSCQRDELLHLLDEFSDCLTDKPGLCGVASNSNNVLLYTTSDIAISRSRTSDERSRSADS